MFLQGADGRFRRQTSSHLILLLPRSQIQCDNHDDIEIQAMIQCDSCGNLCGECDQVLHLNKKT